MLEALGANLTLSPEQVAECIQATGIGFMFAPAHHGAMKNVAAVRKELAVRTIFNILGPLTNPAGAANQLMGVFHADLVGIQVRVLERLLAPRAGGAWQGRHGRGLAGRGHAGGRTRTAKSRNMRSIPRTTACP